jgi:hypothetical protein
MSEWTEAKDVRRWELIGKDMAGPITPGEAYEMDKLQAQMVAHQNKVAPRPIAEATALHDALKAKAGKHPGQVTMNLADLYEMAAQQVPKRPHQSKLFATGLGIVMLGAIQITLGEDYTTGIATVLGGLLTIAFRRFTDRPFRFTRKGRDA